MERLPQWVRDLRTKNTEVKKSGDRYYLYEVHCRYNKETKKRYKEAKYLGILVEGVGLVPKGCKNEVMRNLASAAPAEDRVKELEALVESLRNENAALRHELDALKGRSAEGEA